MPFLPYSAGIDSTIAAYWTVRQYGVNGLTLVWSDWAQNAAEYELRAARELRKILGCQLVARPPYVNPWHEGFEPRRTNRHRMEWEAVLDGIAYLINKGVGCRTIVLPLRKHEDLPGLRGRIDRFFQLTARCKVDLELPLWGLELPGLRALMDSLDRDKLKPNYVPRMRCSDAISLTRSCEKDADPPCGDCRGCDRRRLFIA